MESTKRIIETETGQHLEVDPTVTVEGRRCGVEGVGVAPRQRSRPVQDCPRAVSRVDDHHRRGESDAGGQRTTVVGHAVAGQILPHQVQLSCIGADAASQDTQELDRLLTG